MSFTLPPDLQSILQKHLTLGGYASEEDVLRDALHALDHQRAVLQDIEVGLADLEAGRGQPLEEVDAKLRARYNIPRAS